MKQKILFLLIIMITSLSMVGYASDEFQVETTPYPLTINGTTIDTSVSGLPIIKLNGIYLFPVHKDYGSALGLTITAMDDGTVSIMDTDLPLVTPPTTKTYYSGGDAEVEYASKPNFKYTVNNSEPHPEAYDEHLVMFRNTLYMPILFNQLNYHLDWHYFWDPVTGFNINTRVSEDLGYGVELPFEDPQRPYTEIEVKNTYQMFGRNQHVLSFASSAFPSDMKNASYITFEGVELGYNGLVEHLAEGAMDATPYLLRLNSQKEKKIEIYDGTLMYLLDDQGEALGYSYFEGTPGDGTLRVQFLPIPEERESLKLDEDTVHSKDLVKLPIDASYVTLVEKSYDDSDEYIINQALIKADYEIYPVSSKYAKVDAKHIYSGNTEYYAVLFDSDKNVIGWTDTTHEGVGDDPIAFNPYDLTEDQKSKINQALYALEATQSRDGKVGTHNIDFYETAHITIPKWFENRFSLNYDKIDALDFQRTYASNYYGRRTYRGIYDHAPLLSNYILINTYENQIQTDAYLYTDRSLLYPAYDKRYGRETTAMRGRLFFRINKHNNPTDFLENELRYPYDLFEPELGKWYYVDIDITLQIPVNYGWQNWYKAEVGWGDWWEAGEIQAVE